MMESNIYISVMKIRKLKTKIDANVWLTVSLEVGDINLSTEPANFVSGFALWPNERFTMYLYSLFYKVFFI